ncbi:sec15 [Anaeramoeba ignava]|uniref:Sec15 n=1 Tax=Anaeramoeba ignava TaxID=1746090 RepID=A0A9Q0RFZ5_ANAIG|nr:sec15 [Anaeramoeba ignava]
MNEADSMLETLLENDEIGALAKIIIESGKPQEFTEKLELYTEKKTKEIESLVNFHFQQFVYSVDELLSIQSNAKELKDSIFNLNNKVQTAGEKLEQKSQLLLKSRIILKNLQISIDLLQSCREMFSKFDPIYQDISKERYFFAISKLDNIENVQLPKYSGYSFIDLIKSTIPLIKAKIKAEIQKGFQKWLYKFHKHSKEIGKSAITQIKNDPDTTDAINLNIITYKKVQFVLVYRDFYLFQCLGCGDEFKNYYKDMRKKQSDIVSQPVSIHENFLENFEIYLNQIAGFFVIERTVSRDAKGLLERSYLNSLWEATIGKIKAVLLEKFEYLKDTYSLLTIKELTILFCKTMKFYLFDTTSIMNLLKEQNSKFSAILNEECKNKLNSHFKNWNLQPLIINSYKEYQEKIQPFESVLVQDEKQDEKKNQNQNQNQKNNQKRKEREKEQKQKSQFEQNINSEKSLSFPMKFNFTDMIPQVCTTITMFIHQLFQFIGDLEFGDDYIQIATDQLFIEGFTHNFSEIIKMYSKDVDKQIIFLSESLTLERCCTYFEKLIQQIKESRRPYTLTSKIQFQHSLNLSENFIIEYLKKEISKSFASGENINWLPNAPEIDVTRPYIRQISEFLEKIFFRLSSFPSHVYESILNTSCHFIAESMMSLLLSPNIPHFNIIAILNFQNDLNYIEAWTEQFDLPDLTFHFLRIQQIIALFQSDMNEILDPEIRKQKYFQIDISKLIIILFKYKDINRIALMVLEKRFKIQTRKGIDPLIEKLSKLI